MIRSLSVLIASLFFFSISAKAASVVASFKISPAGSFQAKTSAVSGQVKKEGQLLKAGPIVVDLTKLTTEMKLRDQHMKDKYLEVKKYPKAELLIGEGQNGKGTGKLKVRGVTKDISGTYKIVGKNVEATFKIKLSDFNITGIRYMGAGVKDEAEVVATVPLQ